MTFWPPRRRRASHTASPATPLTIRRVGDELTRQGYAFRVTEGGSLTGTWDGHRLWFLLLGDEHGLLQVRGRWSHTMPLEHHDAIVQVLNDWNRDSLWPTAHVREEDSELVIYGEISAPYEVGATEEQIAYVVRTGIQGCLLLFEAMGPLAST